MTIIADYRTKVFEQFGERAAELALDGQLASQKELDTAAVLQAIQKGRADLVTVDTVNSTSTTETNHQSFHSDVSPKGSSPQRSRRRKGRCNEVWFIK